MEHETNFEAKNIILACAIVGSFIATFFLFVFAEACRGRAQRCLFWGCAVENVGG